jgi:ADP-ribosylglycohydrolase
MLDACRTITSVTHNNPEGMKGAEVTAQMIFKAKNGATMEELYEYAVSMYPEIASMDYEDLRVNFKFDETCQKTVPQAIYCFLISKDFEDCLRTTISIGGDCDTTSAISCAIAEAYYKEIPAHMIEPTKKPFPPIFNKILDALKLRTCYGKCVNK